MRFGSIRLLVPVVATILLTLPVFSILTTVISQPQNGMAVDTDLEEMGFSGIGGSGKVTWKLNGLPAQNLRKMIIQKYDCNSGLPSTISPGNHDGELNSDEIESYKNAMDTYLNNVPYHAGNCEDCHGQGTVSYFGADITAAQLYHYAGQGTSMGQAIQVDMKGLLYTKNGSVDDIAIYYKVEVKTESIRQDVPMDSDSLANALFAPFNGTYSGPIDQAHLQVLVGYQDYQEFKLPKGSVFMLRTPAGEAIWYKSSFDTSAKGSERVVMSPFDFLENPQILFVLMILVGHYTTAIPHMLYFKFRSKLPKGKQSLASRVKWIHWLAIVFVLLQILFYFVPYLGPLFISGPIYWLLSLAMLGGASGLAYDKYFKKEMPRILALPATGRAAVMPTAEGPARIVIAPVQEDKTETMCIYCGSLLRAPSALQTESLLCRECSMPQVKFNTGYTYLLLEDDSKLTYRMVSRLLSFNDQHCLFTSANFPDKIMKEHGFKVDTSIWITDSGTTQNAINPLRLEFEITRDITKFVKSYEGAIIVIDGVNYLIMTNGFEKVFRFIKKLIDLASTNNAMLIVVISKKTLSEEQVDSLGREVDKCVDCALLVKAEVVQKGRTEQTVPARAAPGPVAERPSITQPMPAPERGPRPIQTENGDVISPTERIVIPGATKTPPPSQTRAPPPRPAAPQPTKPVAPPPRAPSPPPVSTPPTKPSPQPRAPPQPPQQPRAAQPQIAETPTPKSTPPPRAPPPQPQRAPPPRTPSAQPVQVPQAKPVAPQSQPAAAPRPQGPPPPPPRPVVQPAPAPSPQPRPQAQPPAPPPQTRPSVQPEAPRPAQEAQPAPQIIVPPGGIRVDGRVIAAQAPPSGGSPEEPKESPEETPPSGTEPEEIPLTGPAKIEGQEPSDTQPVSTPPEDRRERLKALLEKKKDQRSPTAKSAAALSTASAEGQCASCQAKIAVDDWILTCACGAKYHTKCATNLPSCLSCGASISPS